MPPDHLDPALTILDGRDQSHAEQWLRAWTTLAGGDPYSHPAYVAHCAEAGEIPLGAVHRASTGEQLLHTFLLRPIERTACGQPVAPGRWDACTPLLYGGPIGPAPSQQAVAEFWAAHRAWAQTFGVVSEFIRMSPVAARRLDHPGVVTEQAPHVVRDLAGFSAEELRMDMASNVRRGVKKARAAGVQISVDRTGARLDEFLPIYYETMDRAGAADRFYHPRSLFTMLHDSFPGRFAYVYADLEGAAVSVILVLMSQTTGYYYLGGTRTAALRTYCNVLAQYEAIEFARAEGLQDYVLTGGVSNTVDDSLLRFKRLFAPHSRARYLTGQQIFDADTYRELTCSAGRDVDSGFFPAYRSTAAAPDCTAHQLALATGAPR